MYKERKLDQIETHQWYCDGIILQEASGKRDKRQMVPIGGQPSRFSKPDTTEHFAADITCNDIAFIKLFNGKRSLVSNE